MSYRNGACGHPLQPKAGRERRGRSAPEHRHLARDPPLQGGALFPAAPCPPPAQELGRSVSSPIQATAPCLCGTKEAARAAIPAVDGDAVVATGLHGQGSCSGCSRRSRSAVSSGSVPRAQTLPTTAGPAPGPWAAEPQQRQQSATLRPTCKASPFTPGTRPRRSLQEARRREAEGGFGIVRGSARVGRLCKATAGGAQASPRTGSKHIV